MKHTTDRTIGERAYKELRARGGTISEQSRRIGCERKICYEWKSGNPPSVYALQGMALAGFDIRYILTGFRGGEK